MSVCGRLSGGAKFPDELGTNVIAQDIVGSADEIHPTKLQEHGPVRQLGDNGQVFASGVDKDRKEDHLRVVFLQQRLQTLPDARPPFRAEDHRIASLRGAGPPVLSLAYRQSSLPFRPPSPEQPQSYRAGAIPGAPCRGVYSNMSDNARAGVCSRRAKRVRINVSFRAGVTPTTRAGQRPALPKPGCISLAGGARVPWTGRPATATRETPGGLTRGAARTVPPPDRATP